MNVFEPLFLLLALVTAITWGVVLTLAIGGRVRRAGRIFRRWTTGAALYLTVVIVVSAVQRQQDFALGEPQCFDDWCLTVVGSHDSPDGTLVEVTLRIASRARQRPMGERGAAVYLKDKQGRRFAPDVRGSDVPRQADWTR